jgi:hypothetical protein
MRIDCSFLPTFYDYHQSLKAGRRAPDADDFKTIENIWMAFYGLGKFETYQFIYSSCTSLEDLEAWLVGLKGEEQVRASAAAFNQWMKSGTKGESGIHDLPATRSVDITGEGRDFVTGRDTAILDDKQLSCWKEGGYIRVSGLVDARLCDAVTRFICRTLGVDLARPDTWYNSHPAWHGLMLQVYQDESIHAIRSLPAIRQLFTELYERTAIIANTEKVSFNPPESSTWKFCHNSLHWDIDFAKIDLQYIQGLVYLNDVPENRGPLTVVPGFHHRFEDWIKRYPDPDEAQAVMRKELTGVPVPGKKGDVVLWLQTLPHTASTNYSDLPRFVQYVSFSKC